MICGTAIPINPIGPQNAVTVPARMLVLKKIIILINFTLIPIVMALVSISAVVLVPTYEGSIFDWGNVPFINWLRYIASVLLTMFLPGYFRYKQLSVKNCVE